MQGSHALSIFHLVVSKHGSPTARPDRSKLKADLASGIGQRWNALKRCTGRLYEFGQ